MVSLNVEAGSGRNLKMVAEKKADGKNKSGEEETKKGVPFYKLFVFADNLDIILMIIGTIASVANGLAFPVMTILLGHLLNVFGNNMDIHRFIEFDAFGKNTDMHALLHEVSKICLQFLYVGAGAGVASFLQVAFWMCTGERQAIRLRCIYLKNILRQDIAFFDRETSTGEVMARMSADTVLIQDAMGEKIGKFIQFISTFLGGFVVASIRGWKLTLVILCMIPLVAIVGGVMAVIISKMSTKGQQAYAEAGNIVEQTIGAVRMVVSFTGEKAAVADYDKSLRIAYNAATYQGLAAGFCVGSAIFITFCSYAFALWYGSRLIVHEGYSGGRVINVIFAVMAGGMYLGQASPCLNAFAAGQAAAYKMFETINRKPEIDVYDTTGLVIEDIQGDIEFKDVYFRYPARPDVQIFSGFSLEIPKGSTAALVGESGSGKSTVLSLIERFYDPQSGEVLIDTVNIREFQLKWLRQKIGLVSQEPVLLATTIKDNITYGKDAATLEEIQAAAELASAAGFISKMPRGFDTMVGEHGTQLSGGQKQRIAIARAILKDPRILLLDEATSALDVESERLVQQAIDSIMINRTTVIVAHRLTTVRNADTIAVVEGGSIIEKGSHSQLITNPSSVYSQLIHLQEVHQSEQQYANKLEIHFDDSISKTIGMTGSPTSSPSRSMSSGSSIGGHHLPFTSPSFSSDRSVQVEESKRKNKLFNWFSSKRQVDVEDGQSGLVVRDIPVLTLASLNKPEAPVFILGSLAAAINGVTFPVFGLMLSRLIMSLYEPPSQLRTDVRFWSLMLVVLATTCFLVAPIQMYCFAVAGGRLVRRIRSLTFNKVVYQEIGWFDDTENSSGGLSARLSRDAQSVRSVVGDALSLVVQNISTIIAGIAIAFSANWKLALLILALVPLLGLQGWVQVKILRGFAADAKVTYQKASEVANAAVGSIRTVAAFSAEEKVMSLYDEKCTAPLKNGIQRGIVSGIGLGIANFLLFSVYAVSFWVGAWMIEHRETTFRNFFTVFIALLMAALGVSESTGLAPDIEKVKSSIISVFNILDRKSKIDASDVSGTILENVRGDIEFRHVSFRYPTRPDIQIFQDLSFFVHSGKTFALAGESGSGKSTIISLLERFYNPNSGWILFDGVEIQQLQLRWLRQQMGLVSQEPILLNDTIRANIAYGRHEMVSDEDIVAAAEASNCHHFISELTQGYDTWVGERGVQLSGGQKQRIAIARAIIRDPKILLLDEATSALDAESERTVQDALDKVMVNRTTIVVAHRLSTIMYADVIAVVKNGVIAEEGKHAELIADRNGIYASLVKLHMVPF